MKLTTAALLPALTLAGLLSGCGEKEKPKGSPDWGDDPRPLGACVGTALPGVQVPGGGDGAMCLEKQTAAECNAPSTKFGYVYGLHETCASRGFSKQCSGGGYPSSTRFKECPPGTTAK